MNVSRGALPSQPSQPSQPYLPSLHPLPEMPDIPDMPDLPLVLPDLAWQPTAMQLFMFSAVTWNRHRIHYEPDAARAEGHADVVAQRALIGNLFARHVQAWLGNEGRLQRLGWRVLASATPGQRLRCQGAITGCLADDALWHPQTEPQTGPPNGHQSGPENEPESGPESEPQRAPRSGLRLRYDARLTRLDDGATVAVAEGDLCIPATR